MTASVTDRLRVETEQYVGLIEKLRERLLATISVDVNENGSPSRDWQRGFSNYGTGVRSLLAEERERLRLRHDLKTAGNELTPEQYQHELLDLGRETLRTLTADELGAELAERGLKVVAVEEDDT